MRPRDVRTGARRREPHRALGAARQAGLAYRARPTLHGDEVARRIRRRGEAARMHQSVDNNKELDVFRRSAPFFRAQSSAQCRFLFHQPPRSHRPLLTSVARPSNPSELSGVSSAPRSVAAGEERAVTRCALVLLTLCVTSRWRLTPLAMRKRSSMTCSLGSLVILHTAF